MTAYADELIRSLRARDQRGMGRVEQIESGVESIDRLAALEAEATTIRAWDQQAIPGLLQTPMYSAAVIEASNPRLTAMEVRRRMLLKSARSEAFLRRIIGPTPPRTWFVVGEAAVTQSLRDVETHARQLRHLLMVASKDNVSLQVLPASIVPPGFAPHFTLYGLMGRQNITVLDEKPPTQRVGFVETIMGDWYSTRLDDVARLHSAFSELMREALSPTASRTFIREVLESWRSAQRITSPEPTTERSSASPATPTEDASE
ncbi:DUF5753 domain-containing protein [Streptantibioticus rubrisoli]|uniref:DUF5753 domain-containing protein n=1 Tax=Streptantibioticus rubrisoli TaxID=1387313 RepID=A0ABT1P9E7_9ACTN|nr:DUF5753 domain-containing protein [Streptantibioticus rubrisoli]MCQ4041996.1 DUF5753 domain-containing protein [Streptantibioticus rubrisoli]